MVQIGLVVSGCRLQAGASGEGFGFLLRDGGDFDRIPANRAEIVYQDRSVDDRRADGGPAAGVDDGRIWIGPGRLDQDEVGAVADLDAADVLLEPEGAGRSEERR